MPSRHLEPFSKQLTIIVGLTVVGFMAFGLALSYYKNIVFEQTLEDIRKQNSALRQNITQGYSELEYYRSAQYKDKYAKENLGKIRPGEQILIITQKNTPSTYDLDNTSISEQQEAAYLELLRQMPIFEHWKLYLFHKEKIEDLKRSSL